MRHAAAQRDPHLTDRAVRATRDARHVTPAPLHPIVTRDPDAKSDGSRVTPHAPVESTQTDRIPRQ